MFLRIASVECNYHSLSGFIADRRFRLNQEVELDVINKQNIKQASSRCTDEACFIIGDGYKSTKVAKIFCRKIQPL
jgi:hypothetical protein